VAVKIRLKRMGKIRAPFYRIVIADARKKRDGRVIEEIGKYDPKRDPSLIEVDSERAQHWLGVGAQPSEPVLALLRKTGDWQKFKGEPAPEPLLEPAEKKAKLDVFNEVLKEAHGDDAAEAVTARQARKKAARGADVTDASAAKPVEQPAAKVPAAKAKTEPAAEAPAAEAPAAEVPASTDPPADETPEVAAEAAEESADAAADAEQKPEA